jgi:serine/threonine protein kinase
MYHINDNMQVVSEFTGGYDKSAKHCLPPELGSNAEYLGSGRYSEVFSSDGCALKVFFDASSISSYENELTVLDHIQSNGGHQNIVNVQSAQLFHQRGKEGYLIRACIKMECAQMSLSTAIKTGLYRAEGTAAKWSRQMWSALSFLHSIGVVHGDIKPGNMLLMQSGEIRICDFGSSSVLPKLRTTHPGTYEYLAPEGVLEPTYGTPLDVWAAVCSTFEFYVGEKLFALEEYDDTESSELTSSEYDDSGDDEEEELSVMHDLFILYEALIGPPPKRLVKKNPQFFTGSRDHPAIRPEHKYPGHLKPLLSAGLTWHPHKRVTAADVFSML